jgi:hypothetical protein
VAYYLFNKYGKLPSELNDMNRLDKAAVIAFISEKIKQEKEQEKQMEKERQGTGKKPRKKRGR